MRPNPITDAIEAWLRSIPPKVLTGFISADAPSEPLSQDDTSVHHAASQKPNSCPEDEMRTWLLHTAPKRYLVYAPMLLLPSGSFTNLSWTTLLSRLDPSVASALWESMLHRVAYTATGNKTALTHLAVNEGIPPRRRRAEDDGEEQQEEVNILRSPGGLRTLHGDFGPDDERDLTSGFWVSTKQNGVHQVWAPRWTMFSRGNVKEKARLLQFAPRHGQAPTARQQQQRWALDLYAGIGYFVFSYARLGLRVLCWELNPWSVEGLRRGAAMNGWFVKVVTEAGMLAEHAETILSPCREKRPQIIVFLEDNCKAERRVRELRHLKGAGALEVLHVNCGVLPTSVDRWRAAWEIQSRGPGQGWLHLHENIGVADIDKRRRELQKMLDMWSAPGTHGEPAAAAVAEVEHVELVKTYAPGVWHCVFDVCITKPRSPARIQST